MGTYILLPKKKNGLKDINKQFIKNKIFKAKNNIEMQYSKNIVK